jgi:DNA-binding CsgD family transcriptional regulator
LDILPQTAMIYKQLTPRQQYIVDLMMEGRLGADYRQGIADRMGVSINTAKNYLRLIWLRYGIDASRYAPRVRLVYLRARELGMVQ